MKYDVVTVGGATEDMTLFTHEGVLIDNKHDVLRQELLGFEYGAKLAVDKVELAFGGGAANAAVSFARLGLKTASRIAVGNDERGSQIVRHLKSEKINHRLVQTVKGQMSGFSPIIVGPDNEHISFSVRGANSFLDIDPSTAKQLKKSQWVYLTSLSGDWKQFLDKLFSVDGPKIAWNPGHTQLAAGKKALAKYLKKTELVVLNLDEARELVISEQAYKRKPLSFFDDPAKMAEIISSWGPKVAIVTNGGKGATAWRDGKAYKVKAINLKRKINTVGVGDAFGSSVVAGLIIYKDDLARAMKLAANNAARVASIKGAQNGLIRKADLVKLSI
ncbi:carbohydrate kinase family protein [Candidatus Falkowbacteria bacterium]|nr:carbohydrate kinase family protein [Candidatus Falkowbacteria bacterium]